VDTVLRAPENPAAAAHPIPWLFREHLRFDGTRERRRRGNRAQESHPGDDIGHVFFGCERVRMDGRRVEGIRGANLKVAAARGRQALKDKRKAENGSGFNCRRVTPGSYS